MQFVRIFRHCLNNNERFFSFHFHLAKAHFFGVSLWLCATAKFSLGWIQNWVLWWTECNQPSACPRDIHTASSLLPMPHGFFQFVRAICASHTNWTGELEIWAQIYQWFIQRWKFMKKGSHYLNGCSCAFGGRVSDSCHSVVVWWIFWQTKTNRILNNIEKSPKI